jgi:ankyrin repeat protein
MPPYDLVFQQSAGADPHHSDILGATPLFGAAGSGSYEVVKMLLACDADPNVIDKEGQTSLFRATRKGHYVIVEMLLDREVLSHIKDKRGDTPSSVAKRNCKLGVFRLLEKRRNCS